jgi:hypothetical protein
VGTDLRGVGLNQADLSRADFHMAKFGFSGIELTSFFKANLSGAMLTTDNGLSEVNLVETIGDVYTCLPGEIERPDHWPAWNGKISRPHFHLSASKFTDRRRS